MLERLGQGSATITELAEPVGMSLTGMKKHVRVLEEAGLVTTEKVGRARRCSAGPRRLEDIQTWTQMYRQMLDERLDRFEERDGMLASGMERGLNDTYTRLDELLAGLSTP